MKCLLRLDDAKFDAEGLPPLHNVKKPSLYPTDVNIRMMKNNQYHGCYAPDSSVFYVVTLFVLSMIDHLYGIFPVRKFQTEKRRANPCRAMKVKR